MFFGWHMVQTYLKIVFKKASHHYWLVKFSQYCIFYDEGCTCSSQYVAVEFLRTFQIFSDITLLQQSRHSRRCRTDCILSNPPAEYPLHPWSTTFIQTMDEHACTRYKEVYVITKLNTLTSLVLLHTARLRVYLIKEIRSLTVYKSSSNVQHSESWKINIKSLTK